MKKVEKRIKMLEGTFFGDHRQELYLYTDSVKFFEKLYRKGKHKNYRIWAWKKTIPLLDKICKQE